MYPILFSKRSDLTDWTSIISLVILNVRAFFTPRLLTVRRRGVKKALTFKITREIIEIQFVKSDLLDNNIGYIRLTSFNDNSSQ